MADIPRRPWRIVHSESSTGWGGQEHRVVAELAGFRRRQHSVWLMAPTDSGISKRAAAIGIDVVPLRAGRLSFPLECARIVLWLRRQRVQVVNTHSSRDGWLVGLAARVARVPLVVRTRHIDVDYPNRWLSRHAFTSLTDHIFTTSRKITANLEQIFNLPNYRISTIPTGIDLDRFSPEGPKAGFGAGNKPLVGMVSVLRSWKGHGTFLEAARLLVAGGFNGHFVIVGDGPMRPMIETAIRELSLSDRATLAGHRDDVPEVLRALSVLVIASTKHEGVPQIGLQALATKTPVVGSDAGGTPEIIRSGETGRIFPAGDSSALAQAIHEALHAIGATQAMSARGRASVEDCHSVDAMLDTIDSLYRRYLPA